MSYNVASAFTFPAGGLLAYCFSGHLDVAGIVAFAAGTFVYIALADLVPEMVSSRDVQPRLVDSASFAAGLLLLSGVAMLA